MVRKGQRPTGRTGRLSLFHHVRFQLYAKGEGLPTLTQAELLGRLHGLEAPRRFLLAAFLAELAYRLASPRPPPGSTPFWSRASGDRQARGPPPSPGLGGLAGGQGGGIGPNLEGEGLRLKRGRLGEEGVYLGREGVEALKATLRLPGAQALPHLEGAPLNRLFLALKAHAEEALGPLRSAEAIGV